MPKLSPELLLHLRSLLDRRLALHKEPGERRWASVLLEQRQAPALCSRAVATVYCPGSRWHYQLRPRA